jgi:hypothetical protein
MPVEEIDSSSSGHGQSESVGRMSVGGSVFPFGHTASLIGRKRIDDRGLN